MKIFTKTQPAVEPLTLNEVKLHLRLAVDSEGATAYTTEDAYLTRLITVARMSLESQLGRSFITQTRVLYLDEFPSGDFISLPYPKIQSVTAFKYRLENENGYNSSFLNFDVDSAGTFSGGIFLKPDYEWPSDTLYPESAIEIEYKCGYGDTATTVPEPIKQAMLILIADYYEHRNEVILGATVNRINDAIDSLTRHYRVWTNF
jgi:uncharacterized phiE125 gp8 family phage protein